jgi:hypothetical protein
LILLFLLFSLLFLPVSRTKLATPATKFARGVAKAGRNFGGGRNFALLSSSGVMWSIFEKKGS